MAENDKEDGSAQDDVLPFTASKIQGAIWLVGLALLAWQSWWWPGILVLVAISGLTEAGLKWYVARQQRRQELTATRRASIPPTCPSCGSPISAEKVKWTDETTATCPYCGSVVTS